MVGQNGIDTFLVISFVWRPKSPNFRDPEVYWGTHYAAQCAIWEIYCGYRIAGNSVRSKYFNASDHTGSDPKAHEETSPRTITIKVVRNPLTMELYPCGVRYF